MGRGFPLGGNTLAQPEPHSQEPLLPCFLVQQALAKQTPPTAPWDIRSLAKPQFPTYKAPRARSLPTGHCEEET